MGDIFDVRESIEQSVALAADSVPRNESGGVYFVNWMARAGLSISPWWSFSRDVELRRFWKKGDHLSGAVYTMEARLAAIPFKIVPRNPSDKQQAQQANELTEYLYQTAQYGEGWDSFYSQWVEDLITQDNGAFAEIIGYGDKTGPLVGRPLSIVHLDSSKCQRTGNAIYPVIYTDNDGKRYKLHYTRVMFKSQMTSPIAEMYGVGFCAVSRCVNVAQTLMDVLYFKQEKMGSRPHRAILIPQGGLDPEDIARALNIAESSMDDQGLSRYSKLVVTGDQSMPEADIKVIELSTLPDGFDEQTSVTLGMATIALAFGVDARELFPAMTAGATRADALLQHLKQRGKGIGQILQQTEMAIGQKVLPPYMKMVFDYQDDAQDRQEADIKLVRANKRTQDMNSGAVDERTIRELMVTDGDLTREQFEWLELTSGRLPNGTSVMSLFYSDDKMIKSIIDIGVTDPLDKESNDYEAMMTVLSEKRSELAKMVANETNQLRLSTIVSATFAVDYMEKYYNNMVNADGKPVMQFGAQPGKGGFSGNQDPRVKRETGVGMSQTEINGGKRRTVNDEQDSIEDEDSQE